MNKKRANSSENILKKSENLDFLLKSALDQDNNKKKNSIENYPSLIDIINNKTEKSCLNIRKLIKQRIKRNENLTFNEEERKKYWLRVCEVESRINDNKDYYESLISICKTDYNPYFFKMIELDVSRTITTEEIEENTKLELIEKMRNVLNAYSIRNPFIGYCQGFNFIVTELLFRSFSEEETFWIFCHIVEVLLTPDYYTSMIGIMVAQKLFTSLIQLIDPSIPNKLNNLKIETSFFTLQWFVCLFSTSSNKNILNIIWDNFFIFGGRILIKTGIVFLDIIKYRLLNAKDFGELLLIIEEEMKIYNDMENFQKKISSIYISKKIIGKVGERIRNGLQWDLERRVKQMNKKRRRLSRDCDPEDPLCLELLEKSRAKKEFLPFFIFRKKDKPDIIANYFDGEKKEKKEDKTIRNNIVIGRFHHICISKYIKTDKLFPEKKTKNEEIEMQCIGKYNTEKKENKIPDIADNFLDKFVKFSKTAFSLLCTNSDHNHFEKRDIFQKKHKKLKGYKIMEEFKNIHEQELGEIHSDNKPEEIDFEDSDIIEKIELNKEIVEKYRESLLKSRTLSFNLNFAENFNEND